LRRRRRSDTCHGGAAISELGSFVRRFARTLSPGARAEDFAAAFRVAEIFEIRNSNARPPAQFARPPPFFRSFTYIARGTEAAAADRMEDEALSKTARATALEANKEEDLRVPCYCEENVYRLAYRKLMKQQQEEDDGTNNSRCCSYFVLFVSNAARSVAMFHQRASAGRGCVVWDYHVILLEVCMERSAQGTSHADGARVYDLDTLLPYPSPLSEYLRRSFPYAITQRTYFHGEVPPLPMFRLIPADLYLSYFASDRRHMYCKETGTWNAPPPGYSCIDVQITPTNGGGERRDTGRDDSSPNDNRTISCVHNLHHYLNFSSGKSCTLLAREAEQETGCPAAAFGTILTFQQLQAYNFVVDN
jgi:hypothetical protein